MGKQILKQLEIILLGTVTLVFSSTNFVDAARKQKEFRDTEPNNTLETANRLDLGYDCVVYGNLNLDDKDGIDIFKFSPSDTMKVEVTLQGMHNDFDLFVRNSKGKIIKKSLNLSNDMEKIVFEAEEWEDYYIEVSSSVRGNEDNNFDYILVAEKY
ncbi:hypothetical protein CN911_04565 [Bacillus thuringiensis]|uniref:PPC domain-containing protein n=1 Tax=Bacillus thuringiensis TaxID=1428 RepID=UPI000BED6A17|nr:PPC domain-containing protein [Bacillus thuringiensis]PEB85526.1 hypothetical protein COM94_20030 [Bacillus thuringiensis]PGL01683.1 hypothetical protein CN911_04565 [Bacillus thuringiensis]